MNNYQERQRLNELFADLERLAVNPAGNTPEILHELESLRARFNEKSPGHERLDESREISKMPRTALGKLDMGALQKLLSEGR